MAESGVQEAVTRKLGPLPVWAWALLIVGAGGLAYLILFRKPASSVGATDNLISTLGQGSTGGLGGGGGGGGGTPTPTPTTTANPLTNAQWLIKAAAAVQTAIGVPAAQAMFMLQQYLAGNQPIGDPEASDLWSRVVAAAIQAVGEAPKPPGSISPSSYFNSNASWLQAILSFLPAGTPGSIRTEIANLMNGLTTTLSPAAAAALAAAQDIVGLSPDTIAFTTTGPALPQHSPNWYIQMVNWYNSLDIGMKQAPQIRENWITLFMQYTGINERAVAEAMYQKGLEYRAAHMNEPNAGPAPQALQEQWLAEIWARLHPGGGGTT